MSNAYTTKAAVQNYLMTNIDAAFDTQMTTWIAAMSDFIDQQAGYPVYTATPSTRTYDGSSLAELLISPVNTITEVALDGVAITPLQLPYNEDTKTALIYRDNYFPADYANVTVTGRHCLKKTLPEDIRLACTILVAGIVNQSNNQTEGVKSEKIGEYQVTYASEEEQKQYKWAMDVIKSYRRISF
jgi:hypothetical protein